MASSPAEPISRPIASDRNAQPMIVRDSAEENGAAPRVVSTALGSTGPSERVTDPPQSSRTASSAS